MYISILYSFAAPEINIAYCQYIQAAGNYTSEMQHINSVWIYLLFTTLNTKTGVHQLEIKRIKVQGAKIITIHSLSWVVHIIIRRFNYKYIKKAASQPSDVLPIVNLTLERVKVVAAI